MYYNKNNEIMLDSLEIRNFRNLKEFKIKSLAKIKLFTGRNNTGTINILYIILIFISKGNLNALFNLLYKRGEDYIENKNNSSSENQLKTLVPLCLNRKTIFDMVINDAYLGFGINYYNYSGQNTFDILAVGEDKENYCVKLGLKTI